MQTYFLHFKFQIFCILYFRVRFKIRLLNFSSLSRSPHTLSYMHIQNFSTAGFDIFTCCHLVNVKFFLFIFSYCLNFYWDFALKFETLNSYPFFPSIYFCENLTDAWNFSVDRFSYLGVFSTSQHRKVYFFYIFVVLWKFYAQF